MLYFKKHITILTSINCVLCLIIISISFVATACKKTEISNDNAAKPDSTTSEIVNINDSKDTNRITQIRYVRIGNDIPTLKIIQENNMVDISWYFLKTLTIYDSASGKLIQKIDKSYIKKYNKDKDAFSSLYCVVFDHFNFDDYLDIFLSEPSMHAHGGLYLLYNKAKMRFEYAKGYEGLTDVSVNKEKKLLYSFFDGGGGYWGAGTYKLIGNKPFLIEEEDQEFLGNDGDIEKYHYTRKVKNKKGILVTVKSIDTNVFTAPKYFHEDND